METLHEFVKIAAGELPLEGVSHFLVAALEALETVTGLAAMRGTVVDDPEDPAGRAVRVPRHDMGDEPRRGAIDGSDPRAYGGLDRSV